mmetsp:Transcript_17600/g.28946  ORF Transcript_17600/g.28946 Transcript_17600/m.28946 type:complete len:110 (+) Transcript_17600:541-870(+)
MNTGHVGLYFGYERSRLMTEAQRMQGQRMGSSVLNWVTVSSMISDFCGPKVMETVFDRCRLGWSWGRTVPLSLKVMSQGRMGRVFCSSLRGVKEYSQDLMQKKRAAPRV